MIKAIIFDCFGVIITDSFESLVDSLDESSRDKILKTTFKANRGVIDRQTARSIYAEILGITVKEYEEQVIGSEAKDQKLLSYVEQLKKKYKIGFLSNVSKGGITSRFSPNELKKYFDTAVASSDIGFAKPQAQAYEITADRLGVRLDQCVMIDDREDYCQGANSIGMQAILYTSLDKLKADLSKLLND